MQAGMRFFRIGRRPLRTCTRQAPEVILALHSRKSVNGLRGSSKALLAISVLPPARTAKAKEFRVGFAARDPWSGRILMGDG